MANKLESAAAAGCQLGLLTAIWGARLREPSPEGTSGRGKMSSAPLIQSDSDGQVQRGELMAEVFLLSGQFLERWTWRSQGLEVQQGMCAWDCVCVHLHECPLQSVDVDALVCQTVSRSSKCGKDTERCHYKHADVHHLLKFGWSSVKRRPLNKFMLIIQTSLLSWSSYPL